MSDVRVRFAPSPTGHLHVGGARTALFNWLYARHHGGTFVLRIEDTDLQRSTEESVEGILESMKWLGLSWDEGPGVGGAFGPYFQTERLKYYEENAKRLLQEGWAYECFCTPEELEARRKKALDAKEAVKYDRRCLNLSEEEKQRFRAEGRTPVIRFKMDDTGETVVDDLIRGRVRFENSVLDDLVIFKSDGLPTYNFAVVVDDTLMRITHVIRGEDHLSNTPKQIQMYRALGYEPPKFAHIPMILGPDKTRLSKRHGATSVTQFRDEGYLPEAMVNYLALLGWAFDDKHEIFSVDELIKLFSLDNVSKNPAVFDIKKLEWMNGVYIRQTPVPELTDRCLPFLRKAGLVGEKLSPGERKRLEKIVEVYQPRLKTLTELPKAAYYFFTDDLEFDQKAVDKFFRRDYALDLLTRLTEGFLALKSFDEKAIEEVLESTREEFGLKLGDAIQPVRVAVTGGTVSPGIYETLAILGHAKTCERLKNAAEMIKSL